MIFQHVSMWHSNTLVWICPMKKEAPIENASKVPFVCLWYDLLILIGGQLLGVLFSESCSSHGAPVLLAKVIHLDVWLSDSTWPGGLHLWTGGATEEVGHGSHGTMDDTFINGRYGWCLDGVFVGCFQIGIVYICFTYGITYWSRVTYFFSFCWWIAFTSKCWWLLQ